MGGGQNGQNFTTWFMDDPLMDMSVRTTFINNSKRHMWIHSQPQDVNSHYMSSMRPLKKKTFTDFYFGISLIHLSFSVFFKRGRNDLILI